MYSAKHVTGLQLEHYLILLNFISGMHIVLIRVLRQKSGPSMQLIHFAVAFGFFITPIIAKPFVTPNSFDNNTNQSNCSFVNVTGSWQSGSGPIYDKYIHIELHCKNSTLNANNSSSLFFGWVYMISAFPLLLPIPVFIFFGIKSQCSNETSKCISTQTYQTTVEDEEDTEQEVDSSTLEDISKDSLLDISKDRLLITSENNLQTLQDVSEQQEYKPRLYPDSLLYKFLALILVALFTFFQVGYEMTLFTFFFTYTVKSDLNFSKPKASLLLTLQNGMLALFRLISIGLFLLKPPLEPIMFTCLAGAFTSSLVLIIWQRTEIVIWVVAGVYGMFLAPIYPMIVTWLSSYAPSNAKGLSVVMIAGRLGLIVHFVLVGELIENYPPILLLVTSSGSLITLLIFIAMTVLVKTWDKKYKCSQVYYHRVNETSNEIEMTDMSSETSF